MKDVTRITLADGELVLANLPSGAQDLGSTRGEPQMSSTHLIRNGAADSAASAEHGAHVSAAILSASLEPATVYVSPLGSGDLTGSSAENALPFAQLNAAIQSAGAGGTVML